MPSTEEQWEAMKNQTILVDKIEILSGLAAAPAGYDNSFRGGRLDIHLLLIRIKYLVRLLGTI